MSCLAKSSVLSHCSRTKCQAASPNPKRWPILQPAAASSPLRCGPSISPCSQAGPVSVPCVFLEALAPQPLFFCLGNSPPALDPFASFFIFHPQAMCHLREIFEAASDQVPLFCALIASIYFFILCHPPTLPQQNINSVGARTYLVHRFLPRVQSYVEWINHTHPSLLPTSISLLESRLSLPSDGNPCTRNRICSVHYCISVSAP